MKHSFEPEMGKTEENLSASGFVGLQAESKQITKPEPNISPDSQKQEWISGFKLFMIMTAITLPCILMLLDLSIIATACTWSHYSIFFANTSAQAIPRITSDFHSLPDVGWYGAAYMLSRYAVWVASFA